MAVDADAEAAGGAATSLPPKKKPARASRRLKTYQYNEGVPVVPWQKLKIRPAHCALMEESFRRASPMAPSSSRRAGPRTARSRTTPSGGRQYSRA